MSTVISARRSPTLLAAKIVAGAGVIVLGAISPAIAIAKPISENTISSECSQASGTYSSYVTTQGNRYSTCCYRGADGIKRCDLYKNGSYVSTYNSDEIKQAPQPGPVTTGGNPPVANPPSNAPINEPAPARPLP